MSTIMDIEYRYNKPRQMMEVSRQVVESVPGCSVTLKRPIFVPLGAVRNEVAVPTQPMAGRAGLGDRAQHGGRAWRL